MTLSLNLNSRYENFKMNSNRQVKQLLNNCLSNLKSKNRSNLSEKTSRSSNKKQSSSKIRSNRFRAITRRFYTASNLLKRHIWPKSRRLSLLKPKFMKINSILRTSRTDFSRRSKTIKSASKMRFCNSSPQTPI